MRQRLTIWLLLAVSVAACGPATQAPALMERIDTLVAAHEGAHVAVVVRDPHTGIRLDREPDRLFHAASTMKIPVMIEVFRQAREGLRDLDDAVRVQNRFRSIVDSSYFAIEDDSDDTIYGFLGDALPVRDLVFQMITVSSNLATNLLIDLVGADAVQATTERLGTTRMQTLRGVEDLKAYDLGLSNRTTAADLALLLEALMEGRAVSPADDAAMIDVLAAQRFNEMIPAGLPPGTRVAHKIGQITAIHHDAGIVYPAGAPPYVLVILIEGLADDTRSAALGAGIASAVHAALRP